MTHSQPLAFRWCFPSTSDHRTVPPQPNRLCRQPTTQRLPEHPSSISQNSTGPQLASHHHDVNVNSASRVLTSDSLFGHKQNRTRYWIRLVTAPVPEIPALEQWILEVFLSRKIAEPMTFKFSCSLDAPWDHPCC